MKTLQLGSSGPEVGLLRRLLNAKAIPSPNLSEANIFGARYNGAVPRINFGPLTEGAVKAFQGGNGIAVDGVVGPDTWQALGLSVDLDWGVTPAAQPTDDTCYAAAATMVLGPGASMSFDPGPTPSGFQPDDHWAQQFAAQFGWQLEFGMSPSPTALMGFLQNGPFWMAGNMPFPGTLSYHALVVGSIWGDGNADATMLLIYDPWPPTFGEVYGVILSDYLSQFPEAFRYLLHL